MQSLWESTRRERRRTGRARRCCSWQHVAFGATRTGAALRRPMAYPEADVVLGSGGSGGPCRLNLNGLLPTLTRPGAIERGEAITRDYFSAPQLPGDSSSGALRLLLQFGLPPKAWLALRGAQPAESESSGALDEGSEK